MILQIHDELCVSVESDEQAKKIVEENPGALKTVNLINSIRRDHIAEKDENIKQMTADCSALKKEYDDLINRNVETEENWVKVRLGGACSTCAMSSQTLKMGIERKLMMEIPDVKGVIQVL